MDAGMIVNLVIGGIIGWLSGYFPFVKQINKGKVTQVITNIVCGVIGGGAGAAAVGNMFGNGGGASVANIPDLIGAIAGSGILSTISSLVLNKIKK